MSGVSDERMANYKLQGGAAAGTLLRCAADEYIEQGAEGDVEGRGLTHSLPTGAAAAAPVVGMRSQLGCSCFRPCREGQKSAQSSQPVCVRVINWCTRKSPDTGKQVHVLLPWSPHRSWLLE